MTDKQKKEEIIIIDDVDVSGCEFYINSKNFEFNCKQTPQSYFCKNQPNCYYKQLKRKDEECEELRQVKKDLPDIQMPYVILYRQMKEQCYKLEQELEFWKKEGDRTHLLMLERQDELVKEILKNDQLKADNEILEKDKANLDVIIETLKAQFKQIKEENDELKTEFDKLEEQIKLQGNFIDDFIFATKNSEWLNKSILEDEADAIIEKVESDYVQLENYKQVLQEIKEIAEICSFADSSELLLKRIKQILREIKEVLKDE